MDLIQELIKDKAVVKYQQPPVPAIRKSVVWRCAKNQCNVITSTPIKPNPTLPSSVDSAKTLFAKYREEDGDENTVSSSSVEPTNNKNKENKNLINRRENVNQINSKQNVNLSKSLQKSDGLSECDLKNLIEAFTPKSGLSKQTKNSILTKANEDDTSNEGTIQYLARHDDNYSNNNPRPKSQSRDKKSINENESVEGVNAEKKVLNKSKKPNTATKYVTSSDEDINEIEIRNTVNGSKIPKNYLPNNNSKNESFKRHCFMSTPFVQTSSRRNLAKQKYGVVESSSDEEFYKKKLFDIGKRRKYTKRREKSREKKTSQLVNKSIQYNNIRLQQRHKKISISTKALFNGVSEISSSDETPNEEIKTNDTVRVREYLGPKQNKNVGVQATPVNKRTPTGRDQNKIMMQRKPQNLLDESCSQAELDVNEQHNSTDGSVYCKNVLSKVEELLEDWTSPQSSEEKTRKSFQASKRNVDIAQTEFIGTAETNKTKNSYRISRENEDIAQTEPVGKSLEPKNNHLESEVVVNRLPQSVKILGNVLLTSPKLLHQKLDKTKSDESYKKHGTLQLENAEKSGQNNTEQVNMKIYQKECGIDNKSKNNKLLISHNIDRRNTECGVNTDDVEIVGDNQGKTKLLLSASKSDKSKSNVSNKKHGTSHVEDMNKSKQSSTEHMHIYEGDIHGEGHVINNSSKRNKLSISHNIDRRDSECGININNIEIVDDNQVLSVQPVVENNNGLSEECKAIDKREESVPENDNETTSSHRRRGRSCKKPKGKPKLLVSSSKLVHGKSDNNISNESNKMHMEGTKKSKQSNTEQVHMDIHEEEHVINNNSKSNKLSIRHSIDRRDSDCAINNNNIEIADDNRVDCAINNNNIEIADDNHVLSVQPENNQSQSKECIAINEREESEPENVNKTTSSHKLGKSPRKTGKEKVKLQSSSSKHKIISSISEKCENIEIPIHNDLLLRSYVVLERNAEMEAKIQAQQNSNLSINIEVMQEVHNKLPSTNVECEFAKPLPGNVAKKSKPKADSVQLETTTEPTLRRSGRARKQVKFTQVLFECNSEYIRKLVKGYDNIHIRMDPKLCKEVKNVTMKSKSRKNNVVSATKENLTAENPEEVIPKKNSRTRSTSTRETVAPSVEKKTRSRKKLREISPVQKEATTSASSNLGSTTTRSAGRGRRKSVRTQSREEVDAAVPDAEPLSAIENTFEQLVPDSSKPSYVDQNDTTTNCAKGNLIEKRKSSSEETNNYIEHMVLDKVEMIECFNRTKQYIATHEDDVSVATGIRHKYSQAGKMKICGNGKKSKQMVRKSFLHLTVLKGRCKVMIQNAHQSLEEGHEALVPMGATYSISNEDPHEPVEVFYVSCRSDKLCNTEQRDP